MFLFWRLTGWVVFMLMITSTAVSADSEGSFAEELSSRDDVYSDQSWVAGENSELILQVKVNRLILGDVFGIKNSRGIYLGIQNLFEVLDFLIDVNVQKGSASGWFIKEDYHFDMDKIDNGAVEILVKGSSYDLNADKFIYESDDVYVEAELLLNILEIDYSVDLNSQVLQLEPSESLPVQDRLDREKRLRSERKNRLALLPIKRTPYRLWTIPFIDVQTRYTENSSNFTTTSYSMLGAGDLAYMTGTYYLQGDRDDKMKYFRMKLSRDSLKENLLGPLKSTHFSVGDINPNEGGGIGPAGSEVGIRISNRPYGRIMRQQKTDFYGDAQPGWDVELYRNNIYLGVQSVGENGRYEFFNQDVTAGKNIFKLVFYGPQGQRYEEKEEINLSRRGLDQDKLLYDISLSNQNSRLFEFRDDFSSKSEETRRFNLSLFKDVSENVSFQGIYSRYTFRDGTLHNFVKPAARLFFLDTLMFVDLTVDFNGGAAAHYSLSNSFWRQSITYSNTSTSEGFATDATTQHLPAKNTESIDISGPLIPLSFFRMNYSLNSTTIELKNTSVTNDYSARFSLSTLGFSFSNNLNYTKSTPIDSVSTHQVSGLANVSRSLWGVGLRMGASYQLEPSRDIQLRQITKLTGNASWLMFSSFRSQYKYSYIPQNGNESYGVSVNWRTKRFSIVSSFTRHSNNSYSAYLGMNFSLGYDFRTSKINFASERISRTGGVSARVYRDENFNGRYDKSEPVIEGAKIRAEQARRDGKSDSDGAVFFSGLPTDRTTDVELDVASLEDPFLISFVSGYSFVPRPGVVESLNVPLVNSGEIEGTIYLANKNGTIQEMGGVPLTLTNVQTREVNSVSSTFDGFYLFNSVKPGRYLVSIDPIYLKRFNYSARKPMPRIVKILASGNVESGNDFTIYGNEHFVNN